MQYVCLYVCTVCVRCEKGVALFFPSVRSLLAWALKKRSEHCDKFLIGSVPQAWCSEVVVVVTTSTIFAKLKLRSFIHYSADAALAASIHRAFGLSSYIYGIYMYYNCRSRLQWSNCSRAWEDFLLQPQYNGEVVTTTRTVVVEVAVNWLLGLAELYVVVVREAAGLALSSSGYSVWLAS